MTNYPAVRRGIKSLLSPFNQYRIVLCFWSLSMSATRLKCVISTSLLLAQARGFLAMDRLVVNVERGCEAAGRAKQLALAGRWGCKPPRFNRGGAELHCISAGQASQSGSMAAFGSLHSLHGPQFEGFQRSCCNSTGRSVWPQRGSSTATFWNPPKVPLSMFAHRNGARFI